ncbi:MAG: MOSC domain-containing protein [Acidobacteriota bacterium]
MTDHQSLEALEAHLDTIRQSPRDEGRLDWIVRRPQEDGREVLEEGVLDPNAGLVGDYWQFKASTRTPDGSPHPEMQLNIMNARVIEAIAGEKDRWAPAGDQFYVDLDLSFEHLPPGSRLAIGEDAVVEVTEEPHRGCKKFAHRFGLDALRFVNGKASADLRLRGLNAKVVKAGTVRRGDRVRKLAG